MFTNKNLPNERVEKIVLNAFLGYGQLAKVNGGVDRPSLALVDKCWLSTVSLIDLDGRQRIRSVADEITRNSLIAPIAIAAFMASELTPDEIEKKPLKSRNELGEKPELMDEMHFQCLLLLLHPPTAKMMEGLMTLLEMD